MRSLQANITEGARGVQPHQVFPGAWRALADRSGKHQHMGFNGNMGFHGKTGESKHEKWQISISHCRLKKKKEIGMDWNHERLRRTFQAIVIYCSPTGDPTVLSTWTKSSGFHHPRQSVPEDFFSLYLSLRPTWRRIGVKTKSRGVSRLGHRSGDSLQKSQFELAIIFPIDS